MQINTMVHINRETNRVTAFISEDTAVREAVRLMREEPVLSFAFRFPDMSIEYTPDTLGPGKARGLLQLWASSDEKMEDLRQQLQTALEETNGNQSGEST